MSKKAEITNASHPIVALREFAIRYTAAWCSHDAAAVAAFFPTTGTSRDNGGPVHTGRTAIAESAQSFMSAFPDLELFLKDISEVDGAITYQWTFEGTHRETGRRVRIDGAEEWTFGEDGLIAASVGSFDAAEYNAQVYGPASE